MGQATRYLTMIRKRIRPKDAKRRGFSWKKWIITLYILIWRANWHVARITWHSLSFSNYISLTKVLSKLQLAHRLVSVLTKHQFLNKSLLCLSNCSFLALLVVAPEVCFTFLCVPLWRSATNHPWRWSSCLVFAYNSVETFSSRDTWPHQWYFANREPPKWREDYSMLDLTLWRPCTWVFSQKQTGSSRDGASDRVWPPLPRRRLQTDRIDGLP